MLVLVLLYVLFYPEKAEKVAGWLASMLAHAWHTADRAAVAYRVQGEINTLRTELVKNAPENIIERKLKIKWADAEQAEAAIRGGDVVVFMRNSRCHEDNVANALMAYLPKALISRARRYVENETMRAVDLTVAKAILSQDEASPGALNAFYDRYLDPARSGSERVRQKIGEIDTIDLHGWLTRILLNEYRRLGDRLHPGDPSDDVIAESEEFARWLARLAAQPPGSTTGSLTFQGRYFRVAIVLVAVRGVLAEYGVEPYRRRAKRHLYTDRYDTIYLIARDSNIAAVDDVLTALRSDALIASTERHVFRLRPDFRERVLHRERSICVCIRRRQAGNVSVPSTADQESDLPDETYVTPSEAAIRLRGSSEAESTASSHEAEASDPLTS